MGAHVSVPMYRRALPQRLRLEGRRCGECHEVHFPPKAACPNCRSRQLEPVNMSGRGQIYAVTHITAMGAPPEFTEQARSQGGYFVAIVALEEGPKITAQLTGFTAMPPLGAAVNSVIRRLYEEEGVIRYGFKFAPAAGQAATMDQNGRVEQA